MLGGCVGFSALFLSVFNRKINKVSKIFLEPNFEMFYKENVELKESNKRKLDQHVFDDDVEDFKHGLKSFTPAKKTKFAKNFD